LNPVGLWICQLFIWSFQLTVLHLLNVMQGFEKKTVSQLLLKPSEQEKTECNGIWSRRL